MVQFFSKRRLKIAEQIIVVNLLAVIVPMLISGIVINNINQHSNRAQLESAAIMVADIVSDEIDVFETSISNELNQIKNTLEYYNAPDKAEEYIKTIKNDMHFYKELSIVSEDKLPEYSKYNPTNDSAVFTSQIKNGSYLVAVIDTTCIRKDLLKTLKNNERQVYVVDATTKKLIDSINYEKKVYKNILTQLPPKLEKDKTVIFGNRKNQPFAYHKKTNPDVIIIVNTTENITKNAIDYNRDQIILSILVTMLAVFFVIGLYTSYLYTNVRQLFKAILAISKGNYGRRIRLLTNIFTPFELVFLANEFNRMVSQIHKSYLQLKKKNKELKEMDEFRSNMIDTVSHEFRTPLTSIQGYTSRLLRQDIEIDEETKQKSLKIIRRQAERLKRMIEDILVIPDIEGMKLHFELKPVLIDNAIETALTLVKNDLNKEIINNIDAHTEVIADNDRLEQILVNLLENAIKYSKEDSPIVLEYETDKQYFIISIKNKHDIIPREKLKTLFDKFERLDSSTTRTTRGTGLGLYIVKGLIEAMNGQIRLYSTKEWGFCAKVYLPLMVKEEIYE